jgi:hypothetical protein
MKKRILISFILLAAYSIGLVAFAFHSHQSASEHVNCTICHVAGSSEKAITQGETEPPYTDSGSIQLRTDFPVFRFLTVSTPQRAPPVRNS